MIRLDRIYKVALEHFGMKLAAGEKGLRRTVNWVHTVETEDYIRFLVGNELVVITGIHISEEEELLRFTEKIHEAGSSGIVFNIGGRIRHVPGDVLAYADRNDFPVFTLPWKVHLEEFNHSLCSLIYKAEEENENLTDAMKMAVLAPGEKERFMPVLEKEGIGRETGCGMILSLAVPAGSGKNFDATMFRHLFQEHCEQTAGAMMQKSVVFRENDCVTILLPDADGETVKKTAEGIRKFVPSKGRAKIYTAYGPSYSHIDRLPVLYRQLAILCRLDADEKIPLRALEETGILRILLDTEDKKVLSDFADGILKNLEESDRTTGRNDGLLLATYLEENGNVGEAAKKCYLHRNTMTAAVKRISGITGRSLDSFENREEFMLALRIRRLLPYL